MPLSFRLPARDESTARIHAAELACSTSLEPVRVTQEGNEVQIHVHHPVALLLSGTAGLICCSFGRLSRVLCPEREHLY